MIVTCMFFLFLFHTGKFIIWEVWKKQNNRLLKDWRKFRHSESPSGCNIAFEWTETWLLNLVKIWVRAMEKGETELFSLFLYCSLSNTLGSTLFHAHDIWCYVHILRQYYKLFIFCFFFKLTSSPAVVEFRHHAADYIQKLIKVGHWKNKSV